MGAGTVLAGSLNQLSMNGADVLVVQMDLEATETTATTYDTGFRSIIGAWANASATYATTATTLFCSWSGGIVTVRSSHVIAGTTRVTLLVLGYRG